MIPRPRMPQPSLPATLAEEMKARIIGQTDAIDAILPCLEMFTAGFAPPGRPAGVFLLVGPTGTGKTRTVEALAEVLHGDASKVLAVDCGEYQADHEIAKLIGAPPGYLGHRETHPILTPMALAGCRTDRQPLAVILFDEIEKAAPALVRLLLGIMDKGRLKTGDNVSIDFAQTLIFLTSNLGTSEIGSAGMGFHRGEAISARSAESIHMGAIKRFFAPEFINRLDRILIYRRLEEDALEAILTLELGRLALTVRTARDLSLTIAPSAKRWLIRAGTSHAYGARELKRVILRSITQPLAGMLAGGKISTGMTVRIGVRSDESGLTIREAAHTRPFYAD